MYLSTSKRTLKNRLEKAIKLVESTHWIKWSWFEKRKDPKTGQYKRCFCLDGILRETCGLYTKDGDGSAKWNDPDTTTAYHELQILVGDAIGRLYPGDGRSPSIISWNDQKHRKREQVVKVLKEALASLDQKEEVVA